MKYNKWNKLWCYLSTQRAIYTSYKEDSRNTGIDIESVCILVHLCFDGKKKGFIRKYKELKES